MSQPRSIKRILRRVGIGLLALIGLLLLSVLVDLIPFSAARPPRNLTTLEEFRTWKQGDIKGKGTFENSGVTYTVMLAPAGRYLASGPSAYLFDQKGQFVDWTHDMGDFYTAKNRFDLTSGNVKNIEREKP